MPGPADNPLHRLLIVADDLTGACDTAVAFANRGIATRVRVGPWARDPASAAVCALSTDSRHVKPEEAMALLRAAAREAESFAGVFKKIDSVFRGNTTVEIAASVRTFAADVAVLAPAFPAMGRTSQNGVVRIVDVLGQQTIDVAARLRTEGLALTIIPGGIGAEAAAERLADAHSKRQIAFCDALDQTDLDSIVAAARRLPMRVLWIGSGGLARALAAAESGGALAAPRSVQGRILLFVGTDHRMNNAQLQHLAAERQVTVWTPGEKAPDGIDDADVILVPIAWERTREEDIAAIVARFSRLSIACVFMTGGDTAALVARALSMEAIDLECECDTGLPQGTIAAGPLAGVIVVLKSGGFGPVAAISDVVQRFAPLREVHGE